MIVSEMAYKITLNAKEFLEGKSKVAQGVKDLDNQTRRPLENVSNRFGGLTDGVKEFGKEGRNAFAQVQMGAARFLGVALTLEGARRLFTSATRSLVDLGNTSSFLDMSARSLDGFNRAAAATGASEQSMTSMLMKFKNAQNWLAFPMGAPDASTIAMQQLQGMTGVNIMGGKDPGDMALRTATALRKMRKEQAQAMWGQMGGSGDMFNLMYSGNLATLQKDFEKKSNATNPAIKQAREVRKTLEELNQTVSALGNNMVLAFGPTVNEGIKQFGDWISNNKDDILGFFKEGAEWASKFADAVGGPTNAAILLLGMKGGKAGSLAALGLIGARTVSDPDKMDAAARTVSDPDKMDAAARTVSDPDKMDAAARTVSGPANAAILLLGMRGGKAGSLAALGLIGARTVSDPDKMDAAGSAAQELANKANKVLGLGDPMMKVELLKSLNLARGEDMAKTLDAVAIQESSGNPNAVSKVGAAGLYQLMPETARDLGLRVDSDVDERFNPQQSRAAAQIYLSQLWGKYGNAKDVLTAYHSGMGNVDKWIAGGRKEFGPNALGPVGSQYAMGVASHYGQELKMISRSRPQGMPGGGADNSQTNTVHIQKVEVNSNPQTVGALQADIENQAKRSRMTVSFSSGNQ